MYPVPLKLHFSGPGNGFYSVLVTWHFIAAHFRKRISFKNHHQPFNLGHAWDRNKVRRRNRKKPLKKPFPRPSTSHFLLTTSFGIHPGLCFIASVRCYRCHNLRTWID